MRLLRKDVLTLAIIGATLIAPGSALAAAPSGIGTASVTTTSASSSALALGGLLVLGGSNTSTTSQNVQVVDVAGLNVLGKNGADQNTGLLAAVGNVLDGLNKGDCKKGTEASGFCLAVLFSNDSTGTGSGGGVTGTSHNASFGVLALTLAKFHLRVLGSSAATVEGTSSTGSKCSNLALGYILNTENVVPSSLPGTLGQEATNINVSC